MMFMDFLRLKKNMNIYEQCLHGNYRLLSTIVFSSKQLQLVVVRPPGDLFVSKVITHGLPTMAIGESRNPNTQWPWRVRGDKRGSILDMILIWLDDLIMT